MRRNLLLLPLLLFAFAFAGCSNSNSSVNHSGANNTNAPSTDPPLIDGSTRSSLAVTASGNAINIQDGEVPSDPVVFAVKSLSDVSTAPLTLPYIAVSGSAQLAASAKSKKIMSRSGGDFIDASKLFHIVSNDCTGKPLPPSGMCHFSVVFIGTGENLSEFKIDVRISDGTSTNAAKNMGDSVQLSGSAQGIVVESDSVNKKDGLNALAQYQSPFVVNKRGDGGSVNALLDIGAGKTVIGGDFDYVGPYTGSGVVMANAENQTPNLQGLKVDGPIYAAVSDSSGRYYIGGQFSSVNGIKRKSLARINADGSVDKTWNPGLSTLYPSCFVELMLSGVQDFLYCSPVLSRATELFRAVPKVNNDVFSNNKATVRALHITKVKDENGLEKETLYVGGFFDFVRMTSLWHLQRSHLAAFDVATALPTEWDPHVNVLVSSSKSLSLSNLLESSQAADDVKLAYSNYGVKDEYTARMGVSAITSSDDGQTIYVGGAFNSLGGNGESILDIQLRSNLAAIDATTGRATAWMADTNVTMKVWAMARDKDFIYFSGGNVVPNGGVSFVSLTCDKLVSTKNSCHISSIKDLQGAGYIYALAVSGDNLYLGGKGLGNDSSSIVALSPKDCDDIKSAKEGGLKEGGSLESRSSKANGGSCVVNDWKPALENPVRALAVSADGNIVYAGGELPPVVFPELLQDDMYNQSLVAMKSASQCSTKSSGKDEKRSAAAVFDAEKGCLLDWKYVSNGTVYAIALSSSPKAQDILAGGVFSSLAGQLRNNIALIDYASNTLSDWAPAFSGPVNTLAMDKSSVYVGGVYNYVRDDIVRSSLSAFRLECLAKMGAEDCFADWYAALELPNAEGVTLVAESATKPKEIGKIPEADSRKVDEKAAAIAAKRTAEKEAADSKNGDKEKPSLVKTAGTSALALSKSKELLLAQSIAIPAAVNAILVSGDVVYVGGQFGLVDGEFTRKSLVALLSVDGDRTKLPLEQREKSKDPVLLMSPTVVTKWDAAQYFGSAGDSVVFALALTSDGSLVVGGQFAYNEIKKVTKENNGGETPAPKDDQQGNVNKQSTEVKMLLPLQDKEDAPQSSGEPDASGYNLALVNTLAKMTVDAGGLLTGSYFQKSLGKNPTFSIVDKAPVYALAVKPAAADGADIIYVGGQFIVEEQANGFLLGNDYFSQEKGRITLPFERKNLFAFTVKTVVPPVDPDLQKQIDAAKDGLKKAQDGLLDQLAKDKVLVGYRKDLADAQTALLTAQSDEERASLNTIIANDTQLIADTEAAIRSKSEENIAGLTKKIADLTAKISTDPVESAVLVSDWVPLSEICAPVRALSMSSKGDILHVVGDMAYKMAIDESGATATRYGAMALDTVKGALYHWNPIPGHMGIGRCSAGGSLLGGAFIGSGGLEPNLLMKSAADPSEASAAVIQKQVEMVIIKGATGACGEKSEDSGPKE